MNLLQILLVMIGSLITIFFGYAQKSTLYQDYNQFDKMSIEWKTKKFQPHNEKMYFSGSVKIIYEDFMITADHAILDLKKKEGIVEGNVYFCHPEGELFAEKLEFNWQEKIGSAKDIFTRFHGANIYAKNILISPNKWTLKNVNADLDPSKILQLSSPEINFLSGKIVEVESPNIKLFSGPKLQLSKLKFTTGKKEQMLQLPRIQMHQNGDFGVFYAKNFLLKNHLSIMANASLYTHSRACYLGAISWSFLKKDLSDNPIFPKDDFSPFFNSSYWDNIQINNLKNESSIISEKRALISLQTQNNINTYGRFKDLTRIKKICDLTLEIGDKIGDVNFSLQGRLQRLKLNPKRQIYNRALFTGTICSNICNFGPYFQTRLYGEGRLFCGTQKPYGWLRIQPGLIFTPEENLSFGLAYSIGLKTGNFQNLFDWPYSLHGLNFRTDFKLRDAKFSYIFKHDLSRNKIYDHELGVTLSIGAFEPYVFWRHRANSINVGFELKARKAIARLFDQP